MAGAVDASPWDGLEESVTAEVQRGGVGVAKLLGACLVLCADEAAWEAARRAAADVQAAAECQACDSAEEEEGEAEGEAEGEEEGEEGGGEGSDDRTAAALVGAIAGASPAEAAALAELALANGGEDDPWPSLLERASLPAPAADAARAAARRAVLTRLDALHRRELPPAAPPDAQAAAAWSAASRLRAVEGAILHGALAEIETWRRGGGDRRPPSHTAARAAPAPPAPPAGPPPPSAPPSPSGPRPSEPSEGGGLPDGFAAAAREMPPPLRALIADNAEPSSLDAASLASSLPTLPLDVPIGHSTDVDSLRHLLDDAACAALIGAVDARADRVSDTVDGGADHQLNLSADELERLLGARQLGAIRAAARALDVRTGGSGRRPLPLVEAFVRRYTPSTRPWHPLHQDRAYVTVNVALSDDAAHEGGRLVGIFADGAVGFEREAGEATVHLSRVVHGVSRMRRGVRYALICFLGHEPAVRRQIVREAGADGEVVERWTRVIVEE
jgi:hypothetical protein